VLLVTGEGVGAWRRIAAHRSPSQPDAGHR
jgi:hypothetical protein